MAVQKIISILHALGFLFVSPSIIKKPKGSDKMGQKKPLSIVFKKKFRIIKRVIKLNRRPGSFL